MQWVSSKHLLIFAQLVLAQGKAFPACDFDPTSLYELPASDEGALPACNPWCK